MHYVPHIKIELPKHLRDKCPAVQLGQEQVFLGKKVTSILSMCPIISLCTGIVFNRINEFGTKPV